MSPKGRGFGEGGFGEGPFQDPGVGGNFPAIAPEVPQGEIERDLYENEPPGLFPDDQTSYWGQVRKIWGDALQVIADQLAKWWLNLDPRTAIDDFEEWEYMLGLPVGAGTREFELRRALILNRLQKGPFTRTRRLKLVELFVFGTQGSDVLLIPDGVPFSAGGIVFKSATVASISSYQGLPLVPDGVPFTTDGLDLSVDYYIQENIPAFSYTVFVAPSLGVDTVLLERELTHITPAGISFTVDDGTYTPPTVP